MQFVKFCGIPRRYYPQILYILQPVGVVVLIDNTSKYKEFIVTCNTKTHYYNGLECVESRPEENTVRHDV